MRVVGAIGVVLLLLALLGGRHAGHVPHQGQTRTLLPSPMPPCACFGRAARQRGQIRQLEKDVIIHYEKVDAVHTAHQKMAIPGPGKDLAAGFEGLGLAGPKPWPRTSPGCWTATARSLPMWRASWRGSYDSATIANRMSTKAVAQFDEAAQKPAGAGPGPGCRGPMAPLRARAGIAEQTQWLFGLAVLITVVVVVPSTMLNMIISICRPLEAARPWRSRLPVATRRGAWRSRPRRGRRPAARAAGHAGWPGRHLAQVRDAGATSRWPAKEIASGNQDLSARTEQTASNAQQAVAALSQLTTTVQQTASSSQVASQLVASASGQATRGGQVVQQAVASMRDIAASSHKIGDIIGPD